MAKPNRTDPGPRGIPAEALVRTPASRVVVLVAATLLAAWVLSHSAANMLAARSPQLALKLDSDNARALERMAEAELTSSIKRGKPGGGIEHARSAIERDPTSSTAFRVLAVNAELSKQPKAADRLVAHVERLTRRDLETRIFLIERAVARGDVATALRHYDLGLRTSRRGFNLLAPVLASAAGEAALWEEYVRLVRSDPPWLDRFLAYAVPNSPAPVQLATILQASRKVSAVRDRSVVAGMLTRLTGEGHYAEARRFYEAFIPGASTFLNSGEFKPPFDYPPFDWVLTDNFSIGASPAGRGGLDYYARPDQRGTVASQLLVLGPGRYMLEISGSGTSADPLARPSWIVRCAVRKGESRRLLELTAPSGDSVSRTQSVFLVPQDCAAQWVELELRSSNDPAGITGNIASINLRKI